MDTTIGKEMSVRVESVAASSAKDVARAVLVSGISPSAERAVQIGFEAYGHLTGLPDWKTQFTCSKEIRQQAAILRCDPHGYLSGLPPFMQLMFREYAEQVTGSFDESPELIRSWVDKIIFDRVRPHERSRRIDWER